MAKNVRDRDLVRKIYSISHALDDYINACYGKNDYPLLRPAQTYWNSSTTTFEDVGHAVLKMFIKSFAWQRGRSDSVISELNEFDEMLKNSESDLSFKILAHLGHSWHGFNSENKLEVEGLKCYFAETLPAAIYWWLNFATEDSLTRLLDERETDEV